jgi:hypothetical protein
MDNIDKAAKDMPGVELISNIAGVPPSIVLAGGIGVLVLLVIMGVSSQILSTLVGVAFPVV